MYTLCTEKRYNTSITWIIDIRFTYKRYIIVCILHAHLSKNKLHFSKPLFPLLYFLILNTSIRSSIETMQPDLHSNYHDYGLN